MGTICQKVDRRVLVYRRLAGYKSRRDTLQQIPGKMALVPYRW